MAAAPGAPGLAPTWCSSAKEMVGCSLGSSRLWFTIGGGIVNEVYFPRVDLPQIRDLGFIVADGAGFWVEVKRLWRHELELAVPGAPAVHIVHRHERFELTLRVTPCEHRDVLLIEVSLSGDATLRPYALLAPHLGGTGTNNLVRVIEYRGRRVLSAEQGPYALALLAITPEQEDAWGPASAGNVGSSDGWQDFARNGAFTWRYDSAGPGNVALAGELPRRAVLALGFAGSAESAATLARTALTEPFAVSWERQLSAWTRWHAANAPEEALGADLPEDCATQVQISTMVLRVHQDKTYLGAMVASLSVPWGIASSDDFQRSVLPGYDPLRNDKRIIWVGGGVGSSALRARQPTPAGGTILKRLSGSFPSAVGLGILALSLACLHPLRILPHTAEIARHFSRNRTDRITHGGFQCARVAISGIASATSWDYDREKASFPFVGVRCRRCFGRAGSNLLCSHDGTGCWG